MRPVTDDERDARPLEGVRVLDFTMNLPGPYATMLLASLGAEVIKVEPPRGDTARHVGRIFEIVNAGKRSIVVDLKDASAKHRLHRLLPTVDVIVEGFRPGVMAAFDLDAQTVRAEHPRIIYCSVSGFGQSGPYRDYPSHDLNLQALTGVCHMMRTADDHPWGCALPIADLSSGVTASTAICAALFARERSGAGRTLDVALTDTILSWAYVWREGLAPTDARLSAAVGPARRWLTHQRDRGGPAAPVLSRLAGLLSDDRTPDRVDRIGDRLKKTRRWDQLTRLLLHALPHYCVLRCADDRWIAIGIVDEDKFWRALCEGLGLPAAVATIPGGARLLAGGPLRRLLATALRRRPLAHWLEHFDRRRVPVTPVLRLDESLTDPQLQTRIRGPHAPRIPFALGPNPDAPPPRLGADTEALLGPFAPMDSGG